MNKLKKEMEEIQSRNDVDTTQEVAQMAAAVEILIFVPHLYRSQSPLNHKLFLEMCYKVRLRRRLHLRKSATDTEEGR